VPAHAGCAQPPAVTAWGGQSICSASRNAIERIELVSGYADTARAVSQYLLGSTRSWKSITAIGHSIRW
jgi:hypothetical protein